MTVTNDYSNFKAQVWSAKINSSLENTCAMLQCVNRDYQSEADKGVEAINIVTPSNIVASTYGESLNYGTLSADNKKLELDQKICFGITVPDIAMAQSNTNIIDAVTQEAKKGIKSAIDEYLFSFHTSVDENNTVGSSASPISLSAENVYAQFVQLAKKLKLSGAITGANDGWVVVHPDIEEQILLSSEFVSATAGGDKTVREGAVGKIAGLNVFVSNNVGKTDSKYTVLAGTNRAITYASQLTKIETLRAQNTFDSLVRGLYTFGATVLQPKALALLTATISEGK